MVQPRHHDSARFDSAARFISSPAERGTRRLVIARTELGCDGDPRSWYQRHPHAEDRAGERKKRWRSECAIDSRNAAGNRRSHRIGTSDLSRHVYWSFYRLLAGRFFLSARSSTARSQSHNCVDRVDNPLCEPGVRGMGDGVDMFATRRRLCRLGRVNREFDYDTHAHGADYCTALRRGTCRAGRGRDRWRARSALAHTLACARPAPRTFLTARTMEPRGLARPAEPGFSRVAYGGRNSAG